MRPIVEPTSVREIKTNSWRISQLERRTAGSGGGLTWIYVGTYPTDPLTTPDSPPFQNGWMWDDSDPENTPPRFRLTVDGEPEVEGAFTGGASGTVAFTLPVGYRRDYIIWAVGAKDDVTVCFYRLDPNGEVTIYLTDVVGPTGAPGTDGTDGAPGSVWYVGTGAPPGGTGINGDFYLDEANGDVYHKAGGVWGAPVANIMGPSGEPAGIPYLYDTDTANTDPGSGKIKFDNATLTAATVVRISETDADAADLATLIAELGAGSSTIRSIVWMVKESDPASLFVFTIDGAFTDHGTWDSYSITPLAFAGSFADNDPVRIFFALTGDKGDQGDPGADGAPGEPAGRSISLIWFGTLPAFTTTPMAVYIVPPVDGADVVWDVDRITFRMEASSIGNATVKVYRSPGGGVFTGTLIKEVTITSGNFQQEETTSFGGGGTLSTGELVGIQFTALGGRGGHTTFLVQVEGTKAP